MRRVSRWAHDLQPVMHSDLRVGRTKSSLCLLAILAGCGGGPASTMDGAVLSPMDGGSDLIAVLSADGGDASGDARPSFPDLRPHEAALVVEPGAYTFGDIELGQTAAARTFVVTNIGDEPSGPVAVVLDPPAGGFSILASTCAGSLSSSKSCDVSVSAAASGDVGPRAATLRVTAAPAISATVPLTFQAVAPAAVALRPTMHQFAPVVLPGDVMSQPIQRFVVSNGGPTPIGPLAGKIEGLDAGAFTLIDNNCGVSALGPGEQCWFDIRFVPTTAGTKMGALLVTGAGSLLAARFSGPGILPPRLALAETALTIDSLPVGMKSVTSLSVVNEGGLPTGKLNVRVIGPDAGEFSVTAPGCSELLPPGSACSLVVTFQPTSPGPKTASVQVMATPGGSDVAQIQASAVP